MRTRVEEPPRYESTYLTGCGTGGGACSGTAGAGARASSSRVADWRRGGPLRVRLSRGAGPSRRCAPRDDRVGSFGAGTAPSARSFSVMTGLVPVIHDLLSSATSAKSWMAGTRPAMTGIGAGTGSRAASRAASRSRARARWRWTARLRVRVWARTSLASAARRSTMYQGPGSAARRSRQGFQPSVIQMTGGGPGSGVRAARWRRRVSAQARRSASRRIEARVASRCRRTSACQSPWLARL